ncbi:carbohydrate-binding protein [Methanosphaerula palustris]|uniref:carbohydrate-binding protein n=1 Tax=Methanosphaerula palustris TaxID=475088 RepID=UPI00064E3B30|nr:carbohydrate-binding protein [Methanosphaerula palustris]
MPTILVPAITTVAPRVVAGTPYNSPHTISGQSLQAEDIDTGGEEVASHDTTHGKKGGIYHQSDVDLEHLDIEGSPNVGWIQASNWLAFTVNIGTAHTYDVGFQVATSPQDPRSRSIQTTRRLR